MTERFTAREQITLPHPLLLTGEARVRLIVDSVAKIADHLDDPRRRWRAQEGAAVAAAIA